MSEPALFDLPPASPEKPALSAGQKLTLRRRAQIAAGIHPATRLPLLDRARARTCDDCANLFAHGHGNRTYWKCRLVSPTRGPATDIRKGWPACTSFAAKEEPQPEGQDLQ